MPFNHPVANSPTPMITEPEIVTTAEQTTAAIHLVVPCMEMPEHMDPAIQELIGTISAQGIRITGPMFSYHHRRPSDTFDFEIGFPVSRSVAEAGRVRNSRLPAERVVRAVYKGPYEGLSEAWPALQDWVRRNGHAESGRFFERYLNNPEEVADPREYLTELNWVIS
jgi:effector-binding domain-containing protein